jgi:hypothetical protein
MSVSTLRRPTSGRSAETSADFSTRVLMLLLPNSASARPDLAQGNYEDHTSVTPRMPAPIEIPNIVTGANVPKSVPNRHENGSRRILREPFPLVAGTGFEPATSGL